jgi:hypothetical protein
MNDQRDPNNSGPALQNPNSVEARLARAAQQLDTAAANYAYRTKAEIDTSAEVLGSVGGAPTSARTSARLPARRPVASPRRRFAPFAAIGGALAFAGSLIFGASVISNQASKPPTTVPVEVASPKIELEPTSDFPFVGELNIDVPSELVKRGYEPLTFRDGVAVSPITQRRYLLASAVDFDIDSDGTKELAVLINLTVNAPEVTPPTVPAPDLEPSKAAPLSKKSPSKLSKLAKADPKSLDTAPLPTETPQVTSAVAIVQVVNGAAKTLAATQAFDTHIDALLVNRKTLWTMRLVDSSFNGARVAEDSGTEKGLKTSPSLASSVGSGEAILQRALIDTATAPNGFITWATAEAPIARTALPLINEGDRQIRFSPGTTSALVFAAGQTRRGWFTAKAGQTLTIETIGMPSSKKRPVTLLLRKGSNDQAAVASGILPASLTTVLPHGGDYEIQIGEGTAETTFELSIE